MNFLDLCRDVARESGTLAGGLGAITTTVGNTVGRIDKIVSWVRNGWISIQNEHNDWLWMQRDFAAPIVAGTGRYAAADLDIARLGSWITNDDCDFPFTIQDASLTQADESAIVFIDYGTWRARWGRGLPDPGRPIEFSVSPAQEIVFGPAPDVAYIVRGQYVLSPQILAADSDVPEMPQQYHRAITWAALKLMSIADEAPTALQTSVGEFSLVRDAMARDQRPKSSISYDAGSVIA